jgi:hypothetical protein
MNEQDRAAQSEAMRLLQPRITQLEEIERRIATTERESGFAAVPAHLVQE